MIHPIVVGVDGSDPARAALAWAVDEAARRGAPVRAVMAWDDRQAGPAVADPDGVRAALTDALTDTVAALSTPDGPEVTAEVVPGMPTRVLVAASRDAALLVVGSHGHGRVLQAVLGSVAGYCVRHAHCPVVVLPAQAESQDSEVDDSAITPGPLY